MKEDNKRRIPLDVLLLVAFAIIIFIVIITADMRRHVTESRQENGQETTSSTETETTEDTPGHRTIAEKIVVHEYEDITVTADNPLMGFNNPIENEDLALLRYTVDADYESEDPVPLIQEEMWILPGKTLPIDVHSQLDPGVYAVRISILAMDPVTDEELGTDVQYITITVE